MVDERSILGHKSIAYQRERREVLREPGHLRRADHRRGLHHVPLHVEARGRELARVRRERASVVPAMRGCVCLSVEAGGTMDHA